MSSTTRRHVRRARRVHPRRRVAAAIGLVAAGLLVGGRGASAHVGIAETEQVAGSYALLTFGVPHGCDGSPTTKVRIQIPESIPDVTPTVNPNWDLEAVTEQLQKPITDAHGERITRRDAEVVYTAKTPLPEGVRDAFVLSVRIPEDAAGQTLYFPTIQTCQQGETPWIEIPEPGQSEDELESPAPSVEVIAATPEENAGDDASTAGSVPPVGRSSGTVGGTTPVAGTDLAGGDRSDDGSDSGDDGGDDDGGDGTSNGLAVAALAIGVAGLGVGGTALARQRRQ